MKAPNGKSSDDNSKGSTLWSRLLVSESEWPDKEEFLDVIYWMRQILGILLGLVWGLIPLTGVVGLVLFFACNAGVLYIYSSVFQRVDEEEYGGVWELTKEGFMTSLAGFLVTWIIVYSGLNFSDVDLNHFTAA